ncbi:MAG: putative ABC transporter ATP-binding protein YheS [Spirochaetes bacterium ADurb.Bin315]|jgi:ATPase subunit of ABC transporter with duplicated ATPase domains|nr:MAG: putative ABC transporter ATP-binding protein YheS [Spirochaetes bacterium ADurb.Bin315]HOE89401.1 ATP-binding cassette domain-containing protein [Sphaerochaeta sp.]HOR80802.1 ATP-binding cassette domain-containing protein [Sphaerochaeta sp.]HPK64603.1 ATP-binding cassette domain-containing protein [Sphaerochaeta sp.]
MITASNIGLSYGTQVLFKEVDIKFTPGNCYGIIGANGAGKSTFLKILSGEIEPDTGQVIITPGQRLATLRQDHFAFNEYSVLDTVIMGYEKLYSIMKERDEIYAKEEFTEEDGLRAAELEGDFAELGGWEAESEAAQLLSGLGIADALHEKQMAEVEDSIKVRALLAQALFGNPDILLLDEPTNHLDLESIHWLEDFLSDFDNTVIVVSHDRHFLNTVCTHIADIDYGKIQLYVGNYDFWYLSSQLAAKQQRDEKRRREEKIAELKEFIYRFSSNVAKARQATSRKKLIDKLTIDDIRPSSRRFPYVAFKPNREVGRNILDVDSLSKSIDGEVLLDKFSLHVNAGDKIAFVGPNHAAKSALFEILSGNDKQDGGTYTWGVTTSLSYFPKNNNHLFEEHVPIVDWLRRYSPDQDETYVRSFLGRMLFSGDEALKDLTVLSGGEKVRCLLAKMMLEGANVLIFDEPTSHLDLEAITALNNGLIEFTGNILFNSHDHQFVESIANRIIEFTPGGVIDRMMSFEEYFKDEGIKALRTELYGGVKNALAL